MIIQGGIDELNAPIIQSVSLKAPIIPSVSLNATPTVFPSNSNTKFVRFDE